MRYRSYEHAAALPLPLGLCDELLQESPQFVCAWFLFGSRCPSCAAPASQNDDTLDSAIDGSPDQAPAEPNQQRASCSGGDEQSCCMNIVRCRPPGYRRGC